MHGGHGFDNWNTVEENTLLYVKSTQPHTPICKCIPTSSQLLADYRLLICFFPWITNIVSLYSNSLSDSKV